MTEGKDIDRLFVAKLVYSSFYGQHGQESTNWIQNYFDPESGFLILEPDMVFSLFEMTKKAQIWWQKNDFGDKRLDFDDLDLGN